MELVDVDGETSLGVVTKSEARIAALDRELRLAQLAHRAHVVQGSARARSYLIHHTGAAETDAEGKTKDVKLDVFRLFTPDAFANLEKAAKLKEGEKRRKTPKTHQTE